MENTRIAVLSIIVEDSESTAKLNEMIHDYAEYVVGRMGIPYREKNISIISLVIDAPQTITASPGFAINPEVSTPS